MPFTLLGLGLEVIAEAGFKAFGPKLECYTCGGSYKVGMNEYHRLDRRYGQVCADRLISYCKTCRKAQIKKLKALGY